MATLLLTSQMNNTVQPINLWAGNSPLWLINIVVKPPLMDASDEFAQNWNIISADERRRNAYIAGSIFGIGVLALLYVIRS